MRPESADRRRALRSGSWSVAIAFAAALLLTACGETGPYACPPLAEGVEVVANEGPGAWAEDDLSPRLTELWRRGGTREGEELALPTFPGVSRTGRLAVPDFRLAEATVIEPDGTWSGPWTRSGEGPGEIRSAVAASWTADGDLLVFDVVASKVVRLDGPSDVVGEIPIEPSFTGPVVASGELTWAGLEPNGDLLLTTEGTSADGGTAQNTVEWTIRELEAGAERPTTVASTDLPAVDVSWTSHWTLPARPRPLAATSALGALVVAATDGSYRLLVRDSAGGAALQVCRDVGPLPLTPVERGEMLPSHLRDADERAHRRYEELRQAIAEAARPSNPAHVGRLVLGSAGRIWVQRERSSGFPGGRAGIYGLSGALHDVFAPDGSYLGEVRMPEGEALQAALGDTIWTFEVGELDETWVRARELTLGHGGETAGDEER